MRNEPGIHVLLLRELYHSNNSITGSLTDFVHNNTSSFHSARTHSPTLPVTDWLTESVGKVTCLLLLCTWITACHRMATTTLHLSTLADFFYFLPSSSSLVPAICPVMCVSSSIDSCLNGSLVGGWTRAWWVRCDRYKRMSSSGIWRGWSRVVDRNRGWLSQRGRRSLEKKVNSMWNSLMARR